MRARLLAAIPVAAAITAAAPIALAAPILGSPGDADYDASLESLANAYQRQQDVFAALENGLSLDPLFLPEHVATAQAFFAQTATDDFQAFSGIHPYEALASFDEHGDEGNFAGIASVGVAARLMVLKSIGAPAPEIARARDAAVRAARAWHEYGSIGGPGVVARGVRRVAPNTPGDPPFPGPPPEIVPLADADGNPLPADKEAVWRAPVGPGHDGWVWLDDTSKDQVSGYALASAWLWDALHDDPDAPAEVSADLAADLVVLAKALMLVAPELGIDLCLRDADGRLTSFHDLNPRQLTPEGVLPEDALLLNGFNAAMALAVVRAAYHVSGDPEVGAYYYDELVGARDYPALMAKNSGALFLEASTNFSNVNMLTISLATLGRFETDPYVREQLEATLLGQYWITGSSRDVSHDEQAWFDGVYGAYAKAPPATIRGRVHGNLSGFQTPPAFNRDRYNCDDAEIAAGSCLAIDGTTTIALSPTPGHGGAVVAIDIVPMSLRPDSDFEWRSDPHEVNGSASTRMNPGGDFLAAYWFARITDLDDGAKNVSAFARPPLPYTLGGEGGGGAAASTSTGGGTSAPVEDEGCGCRTPGDARGNGEDASLVTAAIAVMAALHRRRDRKAARSGTPT